MSFNANRAIDNKICRSIERLYESLAEKGIILKGIELSKPLTLDGEQKDSLALSFGAFRNRRHIRIAHPTPPEAVNNQETK